MMKNSRFKFRAWDIQGKRMVGDIQKAYDGMEEGCLNGEYYDYVGCFDCFLDNENFEIMQYTDLKDNNGKEIYEGDILHLYAKDTMGEYDWKAVVEFGNPNCQYNLGFQLKPITDFQFNPDILLWVETEDSRIGCEVIGNIYENKKLLEVEEWQKIKH